MWDTLISAAGLLLAIVGTYAAWATARRNELRKNEVLAWVNEAITSLQTTALLAHPDWFPMPEDVRNEKMRAESIKASVLVERGRMFFRNKSWGTYGNKKEPAYRGLRPMILDELVILHGLARDWPNLNPTKRALAFHIAVESLKRFVSMAQQEVGRERVASAYAGAAGDGVHFQTLLEAHESGEQRLRPKIEDRTHARWKLQFLKHALKSGGR